MASLPVLQAQALKDDPFWGTKPDILWRDNQRLLEFIPSDEMAENEKCNALTRFFLYAACLVAIKKNSFRSLLTFGLIPCAFVYIYWNRQRRPHESITDFLLSLIMAPKQKDTFASLSNGYADPYHGRIPNPATAKCRVPTFQNPYMNPLQSMWGTRDANLKACDLDNPSVQSIVKANDAATGWFDNDPADLYQNQQGQRELQLNVGDYLVPDYHGESRDWFYKPAFGVRTRKEGGAYTPFSPTGFGKQPQDGWVMPELEGIETD